MNHTIQKITKRRPITLRLYVEPHKTELEPRVEVESLGVEPASPALDFQSLLILQLTVPA